MSHSRVQVLHVDRHANKPVVELQDMYTQADVNVPAHEHKRLRSKLQGKKQQKQQINEEEQQRLAVEHAV